MEKEKSTLVYDFLISPNYKIWRYISLLIIIMIISINYGLSTYDENLDLLGNNIYIIIFALFFTYSLLIFYSVKVLTFKYLMKRKYTVYFFKMLVSILLLVVLQNFIEYLSYLIFEIKPGKRSYFNPENDVFMDIVSTYLTYLMCTIGLSTITILKSWILNNRKINQLEKKHTKSEIERLKEQITPEFLFNILNKMGTLANKEPEKSSNMLMKLSKILRYQLYDCSRNEVFLLTEIAFINNYLELYKLYNEEFDYSVKTEGNINRAFLPPLIFIAFIQYMIEDSKNINIDFKFEENNLQFLCISENKKYEKYKKTQQDSEQNFELKTSSKNRNLTNIEKRLELLFPEKYSLDTGNSGLHKIIKLEIYLI